MEQTVSEAKVGKFKALLQQLGRVRLQKEYDLKACVRCGSQAGKAPCTMHLSGRSDYGLWKAVLVALALCVGLSAIKALCGLWKS